MHPAADRDGEAPQAAASSKRTVRDLELVKRRGLRYPPEAASSFMTILRTKPA
jgi:hypothetical protein